MVLALESFNQIDEGGNKIDENSGENHQMAKKKIKLNIDPTSSSSASSVNLDLSGIGDIIVTEISTL